jgi:hypothetical protein
MRMGDLSPLFKTRERRHTEVVFIFVAVFILTVS